MRAKRLCAALAALGLGAGLLSACGGSKAADNKKSAENPGYKDTIIWVMNSDQDSLDPQTNVTNGKVLPEVYDGLLGFDNSNQVVCKIAESYEASEDKLTWTFHLRDDVYFQSGKQCTAKDAEATYERLLDEENPGRYTANYSYIESAKALDDFTFEIKLSEPKAFFLNSIASRVTAIMNEDYLEQYGDQIGDTAESVDGCGPFRCTGWDKGEEIRLERFDNYYGNKAKTKEIRLRIVPEQTSRAVALETGQADLADGLSPEDITRLEGVEGIVVSKTEGTGCHLFQFNCASDHAPVADPLVRQAIAYAIDKEEICSTLYSGLGEHPIDSIFAPSVAGYSQTGVVPYDPAKAKELLREAGYPNGFDLKLMSTSAYNKGVEMGEMIVQQLGEVGINAELEVVEPAVFNSAWGGFTPEEFNEKFGWDMFLMGFGGPADADSIAYRTMHSDPGSNLNNYGYYNNAEVDALLQKGESATDEAERDACYARISEIALNEDPFGVFMNLRNNVVAMSDQVEGFAVSPSYTVDLVNLACRE